MRDEVLARDAGGMWPWLGQRISAALVLVTVMAHLILTHLFATMPLSFDDIGDRLASGAVVVNDIVLLLAATFHALNGVRMVLLDWGLSGGRRRLLDGVLWVFGITVSVYGIWALWAWVG